MTDYNLKNIRTLLTEGFSGEELRRFCYDTSAFRPVYDELAANSGKTEIVDRLLEYAERKGLFNVLLTWAAESNPTRYRTYLSAQGDSPVSSNKPEPSGAGSSVTIGNVSGNIEGSTIAGGDVTIHHHESAALLSGGPTVPSAPKEGQPPFWRQATVWWASIVVALITLAGVLLSQMLGGSADPGPTSFDYLVRVQAKDTAEDISNAEVTIEVGGQAPLNTITDSNGVARLSIQGDYAGKPGVLLVEAAGYEWYRENMDLIKDALPDVVQLERAP